VGRVIGTRLCLQLLLFCSCNFWVVRVFVHAWSLGSLAAIAAPPRSRLASPLVVHTEAKAQVDLLRALGNTLDTCAAVITCECTAFRQGVSSFFALRRPLTA
jgi:hypothetical protein